jgi:hypothetical protein
MNIRTEVREIENYINKLFATKEERIAFISKTQGMNTDNEYFLAVLIVVKNRIIHS